MAKTHGARCIDYDAVMQLYLEGKTDRQIADACRCSYRTIELWRQLRKLPTNRDAAKGKAEEKPEKKVHYRTPLEEDAIAAREAGMTYGQYKAQQYAEMQKRNVSIPDLIRLRETYRQRDAQRSIEAQRKQMAALCEKGG